MKHKARNQLWSALTQKPSTTLKEDVESATMSSGGTKKQTTVHIRAEETLLKGNVKNVI